MGIFLSAGIPVLVPLAFINLLSKYITSRIVIQSHSSRISGLGEDFMAYPLTFLPFIVIFGAIFGCWMLTANESLIPPYVNINIPLDLPDDFNIVELVR